MNTRNVCTSIQKCRSSLTSGHTHLFFMLLALCEPPSTSSGSVLRGLTFGFSERLPRQEASYSPISQEVFVGSQEQRKVGKRRLGCPVATGCVQRLCLACVSALLALWAPRSYPQPLLCFL